MVRWIRNIGLTATIAAFLLPMLGYLVGQTTGRFSTTGENRVMAGWPEWAGSLRDYTRGIDDHLQDRFGGRMTLIRIARNVKDNLGEDPPQVVIGEAPWLYLGQEEYRDEFQGVGDWRDDKVDQWVDDLLAAHATFEQRGIPFVAAIAPDKSRIYPEYLPADWSQGARRFKTLLDARPELDGIVFDVEPAILARKAAGEQVYFARDTHWSESGGWAAARVLMDGLYPEDADTAYTPGPLQLRESPKVYDLEAMLGESVSSEPPSMRLRFPPLAGYTVSRPHIGPDGRPERYAKATIVVTDRSRIGKRGTLVVVGDSFADNIMPFLKTRFSTIVRIHQGANQYTVGTHEILSYKPEAVMFLIVERSAVPKAHPIVIGPSIDETGESLTDPVGSETPK